MKMKEIKGLTDTELDFQLEAFRKERFLLRNQSQTEQLENPAKIRQLRRDVARILTEKKLRASAKADA